jgi:trigger factor
LKVTLERPSESEAVLHVELDWPELEKASDKAYRKLAQKTKVPGFRPGRAPRSMLERMVGKETLYQEGLEDLVDNAYREAVREHNLTPLAKPDVEAPELEIGQPYTFTARVAVLPPVKLGDYHSLRVPYPSTDVTDEDVERVVERMRENQAMWLPAERPAQYGDQVTVDLKLTAGDRQVSDLHDNEFQLVEDRAGIYTGMDQQLVGMSEGESKEFTTTIPEGYANTELAGKEAQYAVTVKAVKYRELPELDDELAKASGEYETLDGMRASIREQLQQQHETESRRAFRENVLNAVVDQAEAEVHPILVEEETDQLLDELSRMLQQSRLSIEQYFEMTGKTPEQYRQEVEPEARGRAKREMVLNAVAEAEHIPVGDNEIEQWLNFLAVLGGKRRHLRDLSPGQRQSIARRLAREKATDMLIDLVEANNATEAGAAAAAVAGAELAEEESPPAPAAAAETTAEAGTEAAPTAEPQAEASAVEAPATPSRQRKAKAATSSVEAAGPDEQPAAETNAAASAPAPTETDV